MNQNYKIVDTCGCSTWVKKFVRTLLNRVDIKAEEIEIWDVDYKHISLRAEVWDKTLAPNAEGDEPGGWVEKQYRIRYYEDAKNPLRLLISYRFYDLEEVMVKKTLPDGKVVQHLSPTYLDEGVYRVFGYWCCPTFTRLAD